MEYNPGTAFKILKAMESYKGFDVPSPLTALDEDTGLPPPPKPIDMSKLNLEKHSSEGPADTPTETSNSRKD